MESLLTRIGNYIAQKQFEYQQTKFVKQQTQILLNLTENLQEYRPSKDSPLFEAIMSEYHAVSNRILSVNNRHFYFNIVGKSVLDRFGKVRDECDRQIKKSDSSWYTPELYENLAGRRVDY